MKKILLLSLLLPTISLADPIDIYVSTRTDIYQTLIRNAIPTSAHHDIEIINNTDRVESFSYLYQLCLQELDCVNAESTVTVYPHSKWNNAHDSILWAYYPYRGYYKITAKTIVNSHTLHRQATDYGTVNVY